MLLDRGGRQKGSERKHFQNLIGFYHDMKAVFTFNCHSSEIHSPKTNIDKITLLVIEITN
jgi:hypothetical protein